MSCRAKPTSASWRSLMPWSARRARLRSCHRRTALASVATSMSSSPVSGTSRVRTTGPAPVAARRSYAVGCGEREPPLPHGCHAPTCTEADGSRLPEPGADCGPRAGPIRPARGDRLTVRAMHAAVRFPLVAGSPGDPHPWPAVPSAAGPLALGCRASGSCATGALPRRRHRRRIDFTGGRSGTRTPDPLIKSQLLYQLS